jgi:hypothetical protein
MPCSAISVISPSTVFCALMSVAQASSRIR